MAVIKIPVFPPGIARGVWANQLARSAIYAVESDDINYDTGLAVNVFSIPEEFVVLGLGVEVVTAWTAGQGAFLNVQESGGANIALFSEKVLENTGFFEYPVLYRLAKTAGPGKRTRSIQVDVGGGGGAAGVARVWLKFKPERGTGLSERAASV